jgi:iron complex outermembrane receptor protein
VERTLVRRGAARRGRNRRKSLPARARGLLLLGGLLLSTGSAAPAAAPAAGDEPVAVPARGDRPVSERLVFEDIPVVITASRHEQLASDAPASVAVVSAEEIERYGYRTLAEALQTLPGIFINYDHSYTYIGVRGLVLPGDYNSRVQLQVNGHPMNDNVWEQAFLGEDLGIDMALVERIEVIYGPGSALYGSNALSATINVITRAGGEAKGSELALEGGSFGRLKGMARWSGEAGGWRMSGGVSALDSDGDDLYFPEYDALGQNGGVSRNTDFEKSYHASGIMGRGPFTIQASSVYRVKGIPTGAYDTVFNDDTTRTTDARHFVDFRYRRSLREGLNLTLRGSYDEYRYWGTYRYDVGGGLVVDNIDRSTGRWLTQEAQIDLALSARHRLTFGQGFVRNFDADVENFDQEPRFLYADVRRSFNELSLYAQHEWRATDALRLTSGVRYDDYSTFGSAFSPRFALVYGRGETWSLRALTGRAFRAPNIYELYYEAVGYLPNPDLEPEEMASYEVGFETRLGPRLDVRLAAYQDRIRDLITQTDAGGGDLVFENLDEVKRRGGEVSVRARFARGMSGYFSYALMRAEDGSGARLNDYPPHTLKAGVSAPFGEKRWVASANLTYSDGRGMCTGGVSPDAFLVNATLLAPFFHRDLRLAGTIYNLLDRDYGYPASDEQQDLELIPQDGRTFAVRLLWRPR